MFSSMLYQLTQNSSKSAETKFLKLFNYVYTEDICYFINSLGNEFARFFSHISFLAIAIFGEYLKFWFTFTNLYMYFIVLGWVKLL